MLGATSCSLHLALCTKLIIDNTEEYQLRGQTRYIATSIPDNEMSTYMVAKNEATMF